MTIYMYFGLMVLPIEKPRLEFWYEEYRATNDEAALGKKFENFVVYKIIEPSELPGKIPVRVLFHKEPDNDLSRKYWPK